jgi:hypothetical protein
MIGYALHRSRADDAVIRVYELAILPPFPAHFPLWRQK